VPKISKAFGFELIESLLSNHAILFHKIFEFQLLLKDRICPLVIKTSQMKSGVFPFTVRVVRMMSVFIAHFIPILGVTIPSLLSSPPLFLLLSIYLSIYSPNVRYSLGDSYGQSTAKLRFGSRPSTLKYLNNFARIQTC